MECHFTFEFNTKQKEGEKPPSYQLDCPDSTTSQLDFARSTCVRREVARVTELDEIVNGILGGTLPKVVREETVRNYSARNVYDALEQLGDIANIGPLPEHHDSHSTGHPVGTTQDSSDESDTYRMMLTPHMLRYLAWQRMVQVIHVLKQNPDEQQSMPVVAAGATAPCYNWYPTRSDHCAQTLPYHELPAAFSRYPYNRMRETVGREDVLGWMEAEPSTAFTDLLLKEEAKTAGSQQAGMPAKRPKVDPRSYLDPIATFHLEEDGTTNPEALFLQCVSTVILGRGVPVRSPHMLLTPLNYLNLSVLRCMKRKRTGDALEDEADDSRGLRFVSRRHAMITYVSDTNAFFLTCFSRNGVYVNGTRVTTGCVELGETATITFPDSSTLGSVQARGSTIVFRSLKAVAKATMPPKLEEGFETECTEKYEVASAEEEAYPDEDQEEDIRNEEPVEPSLDKDVLNGEISVKEENSKLEEEALYTTTEITDIPFVGKSEEEAPCISPADNDDDER